MIITVIVVFAVLDLTIFGFAAWYFIANRVKS
jgi:hypothetical protein